MLEGGAGKDQLDGGKGVNTATYEHATGAVTADLGKPANNAGDAFGDTYKNIQNLTGSPFNDKLTGDNGDNVLEGGAGPDQLNGGKGSDTASYAHAASGVIADLSVPANNTGEAVGDTYTGIENLLGSHFNDRLVGDGANNILTGGDGEDVLIGNNGDDQLIGGPGADTLNGGAGKDTIVYLSPDDGVDLIQGFIPKDDQIGISAAGFGGGLTAGHKLSAQTFISGADPIATTTEGTFLYDTDDHNLFWDVDGSTPGGVAPEQLSHFDTAVNLKADDFTIMA